MRVALFGQAYGAKVTQLTHREPTETELGVRDALIGLRQDMPRSGHVQELQARGKTRPGMVGSAGVYRHNGTCSRPESTARFAQCSPHRISVQRR